jgi:hypothetical protein
MRVERLRGDCHFPSGGKAPTTPANHKARLGMPSWFLKGRPIFSSTHQVTTEYFWPCYETFAIVACAFHWVPTLSLSRTRHSGNTCTMADTSAPTSGQNDQSANRGRNNRPRGGRGGNRAPREGQDSEQAQGGNRNAGKSRGRGGRARGGAGGAPGTHQFNDSKPQPTTEQQIQAKGKALALVPQTEDGDDVEAEVCFICASPVVHQSVAPCNHRTCHICSLRLRALYKTKTCAHCRVCPSQLPSPYIY